MRFPNNLVILSARKKAVLVSLSILASYGSGTIVPVHAKKSKTVEFLKYFNPIPDKTYTNESQDRVIKKRKFKPIDVAGARPIDNAELGYFAIIPLAKIEDEAVISELLEREDVNGISVLLPWALLEPEKEKYNFKPIDDLLAAAKKENKTVILRISTCGADNARLSDTPDWAFDSDVKSIEYTSTDGEKHKMPIFWDSTYLASWSNFIEALGEKYDGNPSLHSVGITGGGILGATRVVPNFVTFSNDTTANDEEDDDDEQTQAEQAKSDIDKSDKEKAEKDTPESENEEKLADQSPEADKEPETQKPETQKKNDSATIIPKPSKQNYKQLATRLKKEFGMSERQLVEHWKYVADIFPKSFSASRLNFDINAPITGKKGQSGLDEISDYLVYRYGQRVYLTRQNVRNGKHGFNEYRILLKFHPDTLTGYQLRPDFKMDDLEKLTKIATEDGISFCEVPIEMLTSDDEAMKTALSEIRGHMGYQLVSQEVSLPKEMKVGEPMPASFTFVNLGAAGAMKPSRELDKDLSTSYKIQLELRNKDGKAVMRSLHTPDVPTNQWSAGKPIQWTEELKMPELKPGTYDIFMSLIDSDNKRKLAFLNQIKEGDLKKETDAPVGSVEIIQ